MLLSDLNPEVDARIVRVHSTGDALRLEEIGLRPKERIRVIQRAGVGGKLVALGCTRIALDTDTARHIEVEVLE